MTKTISETIHWIFAVEYYTVVTKFTLIRMVANLNSDPDEIEAKAKRGRTSIKVFNGIFYTLVIACFTIGQYYY